MPTEGQQMIVEPLMKREESEVNFKLKSIAKFQNEEQQEAKVKFSRRMVNFFFGFVVPGLGMLTESYFIITTGQIKALWKEAYPECWAPDSEPVCPYSQNPYLVGCDQHLKASISYGEFGGIMIGMILMGFVALSWSIKSSAIMTVSCMGIGALLMCISGLGFDRQNPGYLDMVNAMFVSGFILLGFGVGGEYPVASVNQTERAEDPAHRRLSKKAQPIRGSSVQLMFSMQGWGAVLGSVVIFILLLVFKETQPRCEDATYNQAGYNTELLEKLWRVTYGLGLPVILFTIIYRIIYMEEPKFRLKHKESSLVSLDQTTSRMKTKKLVSFYWHRLVGTSLTWLS
eukprot:TRINITY_DN3756_c0_g2_i1.p1 TRINITY_DN3756_c0_g2~~TRINITY_DN3756_c0_g2_i1.p1  ORF type:complete len:343 (+),score=33.51 TRINITY_DN3756_c0_g2_i1:202-1230(+)